MDTDAIMELALEMAGLAEVPGDTAIYLPGKTISSRNAELAIWILEAMLHANPSDSLSVESLRQLPSLFPFELKWPRVNAIDSSPRLQVFRQGMAEDIVELRTKRQ